MTRVIALAMTVALLGDTSAAFAGPLLESGRRAVQQATAPHPKRSHKKALLWSGLAIFVTGATLVAVNGNGDPSCATRVCPDPQGELPKVFLGLGLAGIGATMLVVGATRTEGIQIRRNAIGYRVRF